MTKDCFEGLIIHSDIYQNGRYTKLNKGRRSRYRQRRRYIPHIHHIFSGEHRNSSHIINLDENGGIGRWSLGKSKTMKRNMK